MSLFYRLMKISCPLLLVFMAILPAPAADKKDTLVLASTTSTQNSGLFDHILPKFEQNTGIKVHVVAVGTGAALKLARNGDVDVLILHHKQSEDQFVKDGFGVKRFALMHNDFVLIGPKSDIARVKNTNSITDALKNIASSQQIFVSRGDDSGTHKREIELWNLTNIDSHAQSPSWYREVGAGMGATLNIAVGMGGYALTDRATWASFKNRQNHKILFAGDPRLFNQYGVILVNPEVFVHVKKEAGQKLIDWLLSAEGQSAIASHKLDGQKLFIPDIHTRTLPAKP